MHKAHIRIVPGAETAVLFIHGIVGSPAHFRELMPLEQLVPNSWSFHNLLLPGHGGTTEDFGRSSMDAWRMHVKKSFLDLANSHKQVIVAAHSMGTLFALQLGMEYPDRIQELFLLAVPLRPGLRWCGIQNCLRVAFDMVRDDYPLEVATRIACGIQPTRLVWKYIPWIPRYLELFREIYLTEKKLRLLHIPCTVFQSRRDELVTNCSRKVLERFPQIEIRDLYDSTHFYYTDADRETVVAAFRVLCEKKKQD